MLYAFDDFELDMQTCELRRAGAPVALTPKALAVLAYLIQHRDRLVTKEELLEQLWPDTYVDDSAVKRNIMAVRRAIGDRSDTSQRIKTQRGLGYRFTAAVAVYDSPPSDTEGDGHASKPAEASRHPAPATGETEPCGRGESVSRAGGDSRRCVVCQQENRTAARFCVGCGAPLDVICVHCGQVVSLPASFCPACGQRLPVVSSPESAALPRLPLPSQDTQPQRSVPNAFTGEHKLVTVLYCTVGNTPSLIEKLGLDAMHSLMQVVYDLALTEVRQYVGTIQYVTGDSFLVLFGAPVAQEDHARRAVLAAFGLQRRLRERQSRLRLPSGEDVALRMALHTGRVVVGQLRNHQPETATIVGDVTTLAVALARQAKPDTILASAATIRLVQEDDHSVVVPQGDLHEAIPMLERGLSLCQTANIPLMLPTVASNLGAAYTLSGRSGDALPLLEQGVAQAAAMRLIVYHALSVSCLSEAHLLAGHVEEASEHALHALELCQNHKEAGHQAWTLRLLGDIAMQRDPPDVEPAEAAYQEAMTQAEALGMRPLQAHCHFGLGSLYGQLGQAERARRALSAAMTLYQSMDMTFWLPQVEAGLARVSAQRTRS